MSVRREKNSYSESLTFYAWQRLRKNKLAMFGLVVISFSVIIALAGYLITPDATPNANEQLLELSIKPPGFRVQLLRVRKNEKSHHVNFLYKMLFGEESDYTDVPIYRYYFEDNDIVCEEYTGETPNKGTMVKYNVADVVYAINYNSPVVNNQMEGYEEFYEFGSNTKMKKQVREMQESIIANNLVWRKYILGTDREGRDMLSRLMIGTRVSLAVGFVSVFISIVVGILMGALGGFFRGWVDNAVMWVINVVWSIPTLLLVIAITLVLGKGFWQVFVAVGLTMWVDVARIVRGQILGIREKEFVEAGRALGFTNYRLIFKHIIPNVMGPVIVISAANFASAILIEAGLSFLGIGAQPPTASWGEMINAHRGYIIADAAYLAFLPGLAIMLMVLAFVLLGNGLRDALDTKSGSDDQLMGT
ncbi:MAG: ABC transporter permease [Bacteroidia bacterium]